MVSGTPIATIQNQIGEIINSEALASAGKEKQMIHWQDCPEYSLATDADNTARDCEHCRKLWESEASICAHCWKPVSNKAFFGVRNNSQHLTGKCAEKQTSIPARWFDRRTLAPRHVDVISAYQASSNVAEENHRAWRSGQEPSQVTYISPATQAQCEPNDDDMEAKSRLLAALEQQNALLKQLAA